jgi:hypothetical protein
MTQTPRHSVIADSREWLPASYANPNNAREFDCFCENSRPQFRGAVETHIGFRRPGTSESFYRNVTYTGSELTTTALSLPDMTDTTGRSL